MTAGVLPEIQTWYLRKTSPERFRLSQFPCFDALKFQQAKKNTNQILQTRMQKFYNSITYKNFTTFQKHSPITFSTRVTDRKQPTANRQYNGQQGITDRVVSL
jgi:hypothetical protein